MAFLARLQLGDNDSGLYSKEYLVADCRLHTTRHHNHFAPDTDARCERVEMVVIAPGRKDLTLYEWYIDQTTLSGRIVFDLQSETGEQVSKYVEFTDAHCYSISEDFHIDQMKRRRIRFAFVSEKIIVNDTEFMNLFG